MLQEMHAIPKGKSITELLKYKIWNNIAVQHEQYVNKQFNDRKKAHLIEKYSYSNENQIIVYNFKSTHIVIKGVLFQ